MVKLIEVVISLCSLYQAVKSHSILRSVFIHLLTFVGYGCFEKMDEGRVQQRNLAIFSTSYGATCSYEICYYACLAQVIIQSF